MAKTPLLFNKTPILQTRVAARNILLPLRRNVFKRIPIRIVHCMIMGYLKWGTRKGAYISPMSSTG